MTTDSLSNRMKDFYENRTRTFLQRRTYTIIRIDGKAFHTYTKGLEKPFDDGLMEDMNNTAAYLCKNIMGAKFAFVQSDEISILLTDFDTLNTQAWFDYNIQKMCSVSASMATAKFNQLRINRWLKKWQKTEYESNSIDLVEHIKLAEFDARVLQLPTQIEVFNYMWWRQQDTTRNSIQAVAQHLYSHNELNGKNTDQMQEMIFQRGINWNNYQPRYKRGRIIIKEDYPLHSEHSEGATVMRTKWTMIEPPIFTEEKEFLLNLIPKNE